MQTSEIIVFTLGSILIGMVNQLAKGVKNLQRQMEDLKKWHGICDRQDK
jgi:hypothetical protein